MPLNLPAFIWLILLPLMAAPVIYLTSRLLVYGIEDTFYGRGALDEKPGSRSLIPRFVALAALLLTWIPFLGAVRDFSASGPTAVLVGAIPLRVDGLSLLLSALTLSLGTLVVLFSGPYMAGEAGEEKYYTMLVAMVGVMNGLGYAADLFNLWVWFEAMAISSYLLVAFYKEQPASLEAGVKYLIQSACGTVLVLLGIALVLALTGTLNLEEIRQHAASPQPGLIAAGALFVIGFGVKIALAPMHTWLPDAHSQAPSGISALLSGVVIETGLIALLRSLGPLAGASPAWGPLLLAFGAANMLIGNLMALRQTQVKRLLAYSSLAHIGYMVFGLGMAIFAGQSAGAQGSLFHLINHGLMKGLAFLSAGALLYTLHLQRGDHNPLIASDLNGAAGRYPLTALAFSLAVLGLGGLPPLAGFMSKWQIFTAGFTAHNTVLAVLVIFAALNSVLSLAYYAPLVNALYRKRPSRIVAEGQPLPGLMTAPLVLLAVGILAFGIWPNLLSWLTEPAGAAVMAAFGF
jgi:proton-translocating NADH-quinone oxidoreductase chain N